MGDSACPEICDDNLDNDGDLATDCADSDCVDAPNCALLWVADGRGGTIGNLYVVDPATANVISMVPLSIGITGLAFNPAGTLYGTQSVGNGGGKFLFGPPAQANLVTIDLSTGNHTVIGPLNDGTGAHHKSVPDITFVGTNLFGWTENGDMPISLDTSTGILTTIGDRVNSAGSGMATRADGTVFWVDLRVPGTGQLYTIDVTTGVATSLGVLTSATPSMVSGPINSLTFLNGTLYGVHKPDSVPSVFGPPGGPGVSELVIINTTSLEVTVVGQLPMMIDSIAARTP